MKRSLHYILFFCLGVFSFNNCAFGQGPVSSSVPKPNWYNLDLQVDGMFGISIDRAYAELLKGKKPLPVVVAVIDGGTDISHEDLRSVLWKNPKEIAGNGKDDDKNGYIDDINGWNYLGDSKGSFEYDNELLVMELRPLITRFGTKDSSTISPKDLPLFRSYKQKQAELATKLEKLEQEIASTHQFLTDVDELAKKMGKENPTIDDFKNFVPTSSNQARAQSFMVGVMKKNPDFKAYMARTKEQLESQELDTKYHLNLAYDPRNSAEFKERYYGNPNVYGAVPPLHGTHVAGILAADRTNNLGIMGVADAAQLMIIRAIPDGYGTDKDQAYAIRYAADNGAKVINMSFGLSVAQDRKLVIEAVNYALSKDVLFIQAAGNGHDDLDKSPGYPNRTVAADQAFVSAFIKVGASGFEDNDQLMFPFSNYGQKTVDVFAPGVGINSTLPDNKYEAHSGTSMAAPVVSGLAAVIRAYYPKLKAAQVKEIIIKSVVKRDILKDKCITGGVVNAFQALKLAATY